MELAIDWDRSVELVDFTNAYIYNDLFEQCDRAFIQQSTYWAAAIKPLKNYTPHFLIYRRCGRPQAALPMYVYHSPLGDVANSVPEAGPLGGVFCHPNLPDRERRDAYRYLLDMAYKTMRYGRAPALSLTVISNPFDDDRDIYEQCLDADYILHNFTQYIELEELFKTGEFKLPDAKKNRDIRRYIKKAQKGGVYIHSCRCYDDVTLWYRVHQKRHAEIGAKPLDECLIFNLATQLFVRRSKGELYLTRNANGIIGGMFVVKHKDIADCFMLTFDSDYKHLAPNYYCVYYVLADLYKRGVKIFNWQSSESRDCGVYRFKEQWGSKEATYNFYTCLLNSKSYARQVGLEAIKESYPGVYALPYGVFPDNFHQKEFIKGE
jgi:hypothetical protein